MNIHLLFGIFFLWSQIVQNSLIKATGLFVGHIIAKRFAQLPEHIPQTEDCEQFIHGNEENKEFYSPNWPNNYTNNQDCLRILEAPPGFIISLKFLYTFILEYSNNCESDYVEIRNGQFRYSPLEGRYCGQEFPKDTTSSGRFLWIRFRSDATVMNKGFRAVYEFIPRHDSLQPEPEQCVEELSGNEGKFTNKDVPEERQKMVEELHIPIDCAWIITVPEGWKIQLSFPEFKLKKPNVCGSNFIYVSSVEPHLRKLEGPLADKHEINYCGSLANTVTSVNNTMYVQFYAETDAVTSEFKALFTAYRDKKTGENCADDEFDCEDATCISKDLRCNGNVNCQFRWDEEKCLPKKPSVFRSKNIIIIMVVFSLILIIMCITFMYNCVRKLMRDHKTIKENIRQSREQQLNVLGQKDSAPVLAVETIVSSNPVCVSQTRSRSPSSPSDSSQGLITTSGYTRNHHLDDDDHGDHGEHVYGPSMCDSACQTRESLFDPFSRISVTVPTANVVINPNINPIRNQVRSPCPPVPAPRQHYGFVNPNPPPNPDRYCAEAKIKIERAHDTPDSSRSYSVHTTKSAPDVIVMH